MIYFLIGIWFKFEARVKAFDQLFEIFPGQVIFVSQVYAWDQPSELSGTEEYIGDLVTTSQMVTSEWGDKTLFFRHQDMQDDIAENPLWEQYTEQVNQFGKQSCPFS